MVSEEESNEGRIWLRVDVMPAMKPVTINGRRCFDVDVRPALSHMLTLSSQLGVGVRGQVNGIDVYADHRRYDLDGLNADYSRISNERHHDAGKPGFNANSYSVGRFW